MILLLGLAFAADPDPLAPDLMGLGMTVSTVADGIGRADRWTAVDVTLVNLGPDTDATVSIVLTDATRATPLTVTYERTTELPRGTKRRVWIPIRLPPGGTVGDVSMSASDGRGTSRQLQVRTLDESGVGIGVIGEAGLGIQTLAEAWPGPVPGRAPREPANGERSVRAGLLDVDTLPTVAFAYDALDWVVWPNADPTRVDDGAERALLDWVGDGGHLLVTVSDSWSRIGGSPLDEALPVGFTAAGLLDDVGDLTGPLGGASSAPGPVPMAIGQLRTGPEREVWVLADDARYHPLWVIGTYGLGTITVVTIDPTLSAVGAALRRETLWRRLLWLPASEAEAARDWFEGSELGSWRNPDAGGLQLQALDAWPSDGAHLPRRLAAALHLGESSRAMGFVEGSENGDAEGEELRAWLGTIPGVAPLPLSWLLMFASAYLLVIGPIDGLVLRLLKRESLTWITFPIWIAVFSGLALGVTSVTKGSESRAMVIDLVDALPGADRWRGDSYLGLFAAGRLGPTWRSAGERGVVAPMEGESRALWDVEVGEGAASWRAETWSLGLMHDRWFAPAAGAIVVTTDGAGWRVDNQLPYEAFVSILAEDRLWTVGALGAGQHKTVVPDRVVRDFLGNPGELPDLAVATDEQVSAAVEQWFMRSGRGRAAFDVAWHRPVAIAVTRAPVVPLALEGVDPAVRRIGVLRFPVAPEVIAPHLRGVQPVALGGDVTVLGSSEVEIRALGRGDSLYGERAAWVGKTCFAQYDMYPADHRWYSGNLLCGTDSRYFNQVSLATVARPVPWPLGYDYPSESLVKIVEMGPADPLFANKQDWIGKQCTAESLYAAPPLGWASGGLVCDGNTTYFSQVYAVPEPLPATWSPALGQGDLVRIEENDPISYAGNAPALGVTCTVERANPGDGGWYGARLLCGGAIVDLVHVKLARVPVAAP